MADLVYTISVGGIDYDIDAAHVAGTFEIKRLAPVPGASADVLGLHAWNGTPLTILDPRLRLGMDQPRRATASQGAAVVLRSGGGHVAIVVERVTGPGVDSGTGRQMLDPSVLIGSGVASAAPDPWADLRAALWQHSSYAVSDVNISWVVRRYRSAKWGGVLPSTEELAADFLAGFSSPCVDTLWNESLRAGLHALLPARSTRHFAVWNPWCGRGGDSLSVACILAIERPRLKLKIWAVDELAAIVDAQTCSWSPAEVPEYLRTSGLLSENAGRLGGGAAVRARIILVCTDAFEPARASFDMIVCRDRLSSLDARRQAAALTTFKHALRPGGTVIAGAHEKLPSSDWIEQPDRRLSSWRLRTTAH
ncbi:MAG: CheR family methyltransferase [Spirochaetia bacterium]